MTTKAASNTGAVARRAHAKINVFLRVLGQRRDGYHDVETLILPVTLHDLVRVRDAPDLTVEWTDLHDRVTPADLPMEEENLAARAAGRIRSAAGMAHRGAAIEIEKHIPVAAGLGGGSADAAATLHALNELWGCSLDTAALARVGARLGSDVPALLVGEPLLARGRGDELVPVHCQPTTWVIRPFEFGVRAADAYAWWDEAGATGPDPGALIAAFETGNLELLGDILFDDLQAPVASRFPQIVQTAEQLREAGALGAVMSGSGPTVAALVRTADADAIAASVPGAFVATGPPRPTRGMMPRSGVV
jgi:4-diphosphocytidyl-2-C-methyl-D-erythritol kinase